MAENLINIGDIEKFSIVDWPNKIAVVAFLQGCPWRCPFCYNQSLQDFKVEGNASWDNLLHLLEHRKGVVDGVVFSGGEPLMQANLAEAMEIVHNMGFEVGMHTGGYNPEALEKVISKLSWIGFDIKAPFETDKYKKITGGFGDVEKIKQSLDIVIKSGVNFECRTTCDPRFLDIEDIYQLADTLSDLGVKEYHIQKYRPIPSDTATQESACEKFFKDEKLAAYLKSKFAIFDMRK
ncbi:MAG: anaerobic ribonucleoside-triphosphate reductase activating protein [Alphaproteobacteria bacterium]|nr:anaerobic ribonucleoside-triphosphate reductase activating protein [Alphaproteobacteria bacterium]